MWFFGIANDKIDSFQKYWQSLATGTSGLTLVTTLDRPNNRKNPKQRSRMRKRMYEDSLKCENKSSTAGIGQEKNQMEKPEKKRKRRF
jgi:hypothetical protein